jgi:hypothetical protein
MPAQGEEQKELKKPREDKVEDKANVCKKNTLGLGVQMIMMWCTYEPLLFNYLYYFSLILKK